ncbi:16S rRNA (guanine(966)-N(2))-methyltransferase RsmD [Mycobacterium sp. NBC_00419]|uniref:16S rRNA (guanine(966)-N(2))-methyltransferase RsmD n=1 Tax=Mycobacterium sp. NBC_00419 TaxID=2975989 RepID=UPI002E1D82AA
MTRIVAGVAGGRRIDVPPKGTRPTTDRVREALFSALAARRDFDGLHVLDLFAGSGALGLEALSRGAASAVFVESDSRAAAVITRNIATLGLAGATVRRGAVAAVLTGAAPRPADLVLADPPYDVPAAEVDAMLAQLVRNGWVAPEAVVVVERSVSSPPVSWPSDWTAWSVRRYGDTRVEAAEVP